MPFEAATDSMPIASPTQVPLSNRQMVVLLSVWGLLVILGVCALWQFGGTAGDDNAPPSHWPAQTQIARDGQPTLLIFAHPLCPCTRATLADLARLMTICRGRVDTHVLFIAPKGMDAASNTSGLYGQAREIPGVSVSEDQDRREAKLFSVRTSGSCLLYNAAGNLMFHGGLTSERGHEGDSIGSVAIEKILLGKSVETTVSQVFGCPLFEKTTPPTRTTGI
jgi:hypothetical protein